MSYLKLLSALDSRIILSPFLKGCELLNKVNVPNVAESTPLEDKIALSHVVGFGPTLFGVVDNGIAGT